MRNSPVLERVRHLLRTKHFDAALSRVSGVASTAEDYVEARVLGARCLMSAARFRTAAVSANAAARNVGDQDDLLILRVAAAAAEMLAQPSIGSLDAVRRLAAAMPATARPLWRAYARMFDARRSTAEVTLQVRSIAGLNEAKRFLEEAHALFEEAQRPEEAWDELAMFAEITQAGPPPRPEEAVPLWKTARETAGARADAVGSARAALALANLALETAFSQGQPWNGVDEWPAFQRTSELYLDAGFAGGDAPVQAALGRTLLRYGAGDGVPLLTTAAERWEAVGDAGMANGVWRDLHLWHLRAGETAAAANAQVKLLRAQSIESDLTLPTDAVAAANHAYVQAEFATARQTAAAAMRAATTPGQEAGLLLQQASALLGSGDTAEAARQAERAVNVLRPAAPCVLLGDALFHLGMARGAASEIRRLWTEAARNDEVCGLFSGAAMKLMNLAQFLGQPQADGSMAGSPEEAEQLYAQAGRLLADSRDLESLVAKGNLAQRRGQTALLREDYLACGHFLSEAEDNFRATGRVADLAFPLGQQGLVLFRAARQGGDRALWREAQRKFGEARELFARQGLRSEEVRMLYLHGAAMVEEGRLVDAGQRAACHEAAAAFLEEAAVLLERMRGGRREAEMLTAQASRENFAREQQRVYDLGLRLHLRMCPQPDRALLWLERMKARALLDSMAETSMVFKAPPDADPALVAREQSLEQEQVQLAVRAQVLREKDSGFPHPALTLEQAADARRLLELNQELEHVWEAMTARPETSAYATLRLGRPVGWPDLRRALQRESARPEARGRPVVMAHFVWPFATDPLQRIHMLVSRGDWEEPRVAAVEVAPKDLLNFAEPCFGNSGSPLSNLRGFLEDAGGDTAWRDGFAGLVAPLARWTEPGDILCLVPHGPLHGLPLHALNLDGIPLAERNAVFHAPSAAVFLSCIERERGHPGGVGPVGAAVFGCSLPAGLLPPLPQAVEEARFVAGQPWLHVDGGPILDADVTRENVVRSLPDATVLHFVGHAVEAATGWESAIILAGGERMTALDFMRVRLRADLVTLSGCRTARSRWRPGDEALGLTPALLYAGASSVLTSQWEAQERPTELLMERFYELVYGVERMSKAEAWRLAIREVRSRYPALADWAPFVLQGDWK